LYIYINKQNETKNLNDFKKSLKLKCLFLILAADLCELLLHFARYS